MMLSIGFGFNSSKYWNWIYYYPMILVIWKFQHFCSEEGGEHDYGELPMVSGLKSNVLSFFFLIILHLLCINATYINTVLLSLSRSSRITARDTSLHVKHVNTHVCVCVCVCVCVEIWSRSADREQMFPTHPSNRRRRRVQQCGR